MQKPHIQVICDKSDWMNSTIQVVNVIGDNNLKVKARYTQLKGNELPLNLKPIFEAIISSFQSSGNQKWFASIVFCYRIVKKTHTEVSVEYQKDEEGNIVLDETGHPIELSRVETEVVDNNDGVQFKSNVDIPDGTATNLDQIVEDPNIILLFDTITSIDFWKGRVLE